MCSRSGIFIPPELGRTIGVALVTVMIFGIVMVSSAIWAVGGAALGRVAEDERRRRAVSVVLALLLVASVVLLWL